MRAQPVGRQDLNIALKGVRAEVKTMFQDAVSQLRDIVMGARLPDGGLDKRRERDVLQRSGIVIQRLFVGADGRNAYATDGVTALAPFPHILNKWYGMVVVASVRRQAGWLQRNIPDDVFRFLATMPTRPAVTVGEAENPFLRRRGESDADYLKRLAPLRIFRPNPLAELDPDRQWVPMQNWTDDRGYRLSDRIWQAGERTRTKIDALIAEAMREGKSAEWLAQRLERFLLPDRAGIRTNRPYGRDGSYDAMRIARTEIARAANQAAFTSAYLNPYVDRIDVARSANGDASCPICPQHATLGIGGERLREPYPVTSADIPIYHVHCMCHIRPVTTDNPQVVTERLRAIMEDERLQFLEGVTNPAQADALIQQLLGDVIWRLVAQALL